TTEVILDVERKDFLRRTPVVGRQNYFQQPLDDEGITVSVEIQPATLVAAGQPYLALATTHHVLLDPGLLVERRQLAPQVDDALVTILPAVEEGQAVENVVAAHVSTKLAHEKSLEEQAGFQLSLFAHHAAAPGRIKHQIDRDLGYIGNQPHAVFHPPDQYPALATDRSRDCHRDFAAPFLLVAAHRLAR